MGPCPDPDGDPIIPLEAALDLNQEGFQIIERGVRRLVEVLWRRGYRTVCSCAGHIKELDPFPWIAISLDLNAPIKLAKIANAVARFNMMFGKDGHLPEWEDTWTLCPLISPSGFSIYLHPLDSNKIRSLSRISELRQRADVLASLFEKELDG